MIQRRYDKGKKIRKILLINSDNEMQKKIKSKKYILINSKTPKELERLYCLDEEPINTSISTYTNILEKHIVGKIVDIPKKINYFYSDMLDDNKEGLKKRIIKYQGLLYSAKNFIVNYDHLIDHDKNEKNKEKDNKEHIMENIIPFVTKKRSVGAEKIKGCKLEPLDEIDQKNILNNNKIEPNKIIIKNNEEINSNISSDFNHNYQNNYAKNDKNQNSKKGMDINSKLIYYCYTYLKRKRPIVSKTNNTSIYGLQTEEEVYKRYKTIKEEKLPNNVIPLKIKVSKSNKVIKRTTKHLNSKKKNKKEDIKTKNKKSRNKHITNKEMFKKNFDNIHNQDTNYHNSLENGVNFIRAITKKIKSIRSEKKDKERIKRISVVGNVKRRANSITKKSRNENIKSSSHHKRIIKIRNSTTQNITSKADTKNSSIDNASSDGFVSVKNKNEKKYNNIHLNKLKKENNDKKGKNEAKIKIDKKEKDSKIKKYKYITHNKVKKEMPEENKCKKSRFLTTKISTKEPVRGKIINALKNHIDFDLDDLNYLKDNKKTVYRNNQNSKLKHIGKTKSFKIKNKKYFFNYEVNSPDEYILSKRI